MIFSTIRIALCGAMMGTLVQAQALPVAEIDAGGLTFDFEKASRELFRRGTDGKNLLAADGSFEIPYREGARFLSVTTPSGYRTEWPHLALPRKWQKYEFPLSRDPLSGGKEPK